MALAARQRLVSLHEAIVEHPSRSLTDKEESLDEHGTIILAL